MKIALAIREVTGQETEQIVELKKNRNPTFTTAVRNLPEILAEGMRAAGYLPLTHLQLKMQDDKGAVIEIRIQYPNKDVSCILTGEGIEP